MAATIVTTFRKILQEEFSDSFANLGAVLLLSLPLFQSMVEMINMEMPCTFFAVLAVYACTLRRFGMAATFAILALLIKAPGAIACATVFVAAILLIIQEPKDKYSYRAAFWGALACIAVVAKGYLRSQIIGDQTPNNTVGLFIGWPNIARLHVFKIFIGLIIIAKIHWLIRLIKIRKQRLPFASLFLDENASILMFTIGFFWFALYLNFSVMGYRYELLLAPFFWFACLYAAEMFIRSPRWLNGITMGVIFFSFICSHGLLYKEKYESSVYSYNHLERSLEYRNDLKMHMEMARTIEEEHPTATIGAPWVTAHSMAMPEVGYVDKALDVMIYGYPAAHGMRSFTGLKDLDIRNTVWIAFHKSHINAPFPYPIDPRDKVIKEFQLGDKRALLFMGGLAIEKMRILVELYQGRS